MGTAKPPANAACSNNCQDFTRGSARAFDDDDDHTRPKCSGGLMICEGRSHLQGGDWQCFCDRSKKSGPSRKIYYEAFYPRSDAMSEGLTVSDWLSLLSASRHAVVAPLHCCAMIATCASQLSARMLSVHTSKSWTESLFRCTNKAVLSLRITRNGTSGLCNTVYKSLAALAIRNSYRVETLQSHIEQDAVMKMKPQASRQMFHGSISLLIMLVV